MTKRSEKIPTATERIAERVRDFRTSATFDQANAAALLTALGSPTKASTITRMESGAQPPTVEQALLLALVASPEGLRNLLRPPFTIGSLVVESEEDLDAILAGWPRDEMPSIVSQYHERSKDLWQRERDRMIATSLNTDQKRVSRAAERLYGRSAYDEIVSRFNVRLAEISPAPEPESARWRAYRSHAVRAVTKEIGEALR